MITKVYNFSSAKKKKTFENSSNCYLTTLKPSFSKAIKQEAERVKQWCKSV